MLSMKRILAANKNLEIQSMNNSQVQLPKNVIFIPQQRGSLILYPLVSIYRSKLKNKENKPMRRRFFNADKYIQNKTYIWVPQITVTNYNVQYSTGITRQRQYTETTGTDSTGPEHTNNEQLCRQSNSLTNGSITNRSVFQDEHIFTVDSFHTHSSLIHVCCITQQNNFTPTHPSKWITNRGKQAQHVHHSAFNGYSESTALKSRSIRTCSLYCSQQFFQSYTFTFYLKMIVVFLIQEHTLQLYSHTR